MRKLMGKIFAAQGEKERGENENTKGEKEPEFLVRFARNGLEALAEIAREKPDVVTMDIHMPELDGLACLDRIMVECPCPVVMVSSLTVQGTDIALEALQRGAVDIVVKPKMIAFGIEVISAQLKETVRNAATAKLRSTLRLRERVQYRIGAARTPSVPPSRSEVTHGLVLIGTSTGGPPALETLLTALHENFPWPLLVAQHMPAGFTAALARRLDQICALRVVEVAEATILAPGFVYIGRGNTDMIVASSRDGLVAMPVAPQPDYLWHPSADRLVRSALQVVAPERLIGILMTGMGTDGAVAMAALRKSGGKTIAESEETAVVWGMPGKLVRLGGADFILPVTAIATRLQALLG